MKRGEIRAELVKALIPAGLSAAVAVTAFFFVGQYQLSLVKQELVNTGLQTDMLRLQRARAVSQALSDLTPKVFVQYKNDKDPSSDGYTIWIDLINSGPFSVECFYSNPRTSHSEYSVRYGADPGIIQGHSTLSQSFDAIGPVPADGEVIDLMFDVTCQAQELETRPFEDIALEEYSAAEIAGRKAFTFTYTFRLTNDPSPL